MKQAKQKEFALRQAFNVDTSDKLAELITYEEDHYISSLEQQCEKYGIRSDVLANIQRVAKYGSYEDMQMLADGINKVA